MWKLFVASLKMYLRQREAIIWNFVLPVLTIVIFGFVQFGGIGHMHLGVVNEAGAGGTAVIEALGNVKSIEMYQGPLGRQMEDLEKGAVDLVLVIPDSFSVHRPTGLTLYADVEARPQEAQVGELALQRVLDDMTFSALHVDNRVQVTTRPVKTRNLRYIDFLVPGVLSMTIMQVGIFGVAFGFVSLKKRGILRRLWVTPIRPGHFILAQVASRVLVLIVQMSVMLATGILLFHFHLLGNIGAILVVGLFGALVFLSIGFAVAGISKSEDQAAPLANIITLPMMLLSGVFFSRVSLPGVVYTITGFFPLTYLADAMRSVVVDGSTLVNVAPQLAGLAVWSLIAVFAAVKMFRWE